ncbi:aldehyde dehydrogenase [Ureibacillus chungkukjangi]|uniref:Aldehyde dehydrogenase (Acceptor) n=1 Tax=Ureibacillus chungkukjangi TaxID=1202712 RepID=A0A318TL39_9BACL|nr:aldehyde dehydrogenase [Ureibacillus chungkukjangi]MCM3389367.1 aldehyde dehydrogenase [Ureibacillus chungkukjangi]PYF05133.1 aldehyde dehydrogenase (acceptor) [Ureibacillus chungkukjangi]
MEKFHGYFINNEFLETENYTKLVSPINGEFWAEIPDCTEHETTQAILAARKAFENGWSETDVTKVSKLLRRLGDLVLKNKERLATLECKGNGKLYIELIENEIPAVAEWFYFYSGVAAQLRGEYVEISKNVFSYIKKEPIGVVGAIVPWNSPLLMLAWKVAPALATRNTIVLKPAIQTSVSALAFAELIVEAGIPAGVVNIVTGDLPVAKTLTTHPEIDKLGFTGSTNTAISIAKQSSDTLKKLTFELGGKAPHIIFEDADMEKATNAAVRGIFINAGQTCAAGSRVFIEETIYEECLAKIIEQTKKIKVGDPFEVDSVMGPISIAEQLDKLQTFIESVKADGGSIIYGGEQINLNNGGFYFSPTIVTNLNNDSYLCREEVFGPILAIIPFKNEDDVIKMANDSKYGLTAGVWTKNLARAHRISNKLQSGTVWINNYRKIHWSVPYGGYKMSGYGRENGLEVINEFTEIKTIMIDITSDDE